MCVVILQLQTISPQDCSAAVKLLILLFSDVKMSRKWESHKGWEKARQQSLPDRIAEENKRKERENQQEEENKKREK